MGGQWQANSGRQAGMQRRRHQEEQRQRDQQNRLALLGGRACLIVLALACGQQLAGRVELTLTDFGICRPPLSLPPPLQRCCCATTARPQTCGAWVSACTRCSAGCCPSLETPRRRCLTWCCMQVRLEGWLVDLMRSFVQVFSRHSCRCCYCWVCNDWEALPLQAPLAS